MADDIAITPGSGATVATDDVSGRHHQVVKIADGTDGSGTTVPGSAAKGLYVDPRGSTNRIQVASTGLTTATTAYTNGDQLGALIEFTNVARASGGGAVIQSATLLDKAKLVGGVDLFLFDRSVTAAADNAANAFSDADMLNCLGVLTFPGPRVSANNNIATAEMSGLAVVCNATSIFGALVTRSDHTFFGAVDDLVVSLTVLQD